MTNNAKNLQSYKEHEILTIEEVAEYLRVSERTVYAWAQKGEIPSGKIGTIWRFKRAEIERWVNERLGTGGILPEPRSVDLRDLITPERVVTLHSVGKNAALAELIAVLSRSDAIRDPAELSAAVARRESLMSTAIGSGMAVPHVRLWSVENLVMAVGCSAAGIADYETLDGKPVWLIFMVAAPHEQHAQYLWTLSTIMARMKRDEFRERLAAAKEPRRVYELLTERPD